MNSPFGDVFEDITKGSAVADGAALAAGRAVAEGLMVGVIVGVSAFIVGVIIAIVGTTAGLCEQDAKAIIDKRNQMMILRNLILPAAQL